MAGCETLLERLHEAPRHPADFLVCYRLLWLFGELERGAGEGGHRSQDQAVDQALSRLSLPNSGEDLLPEAAMYYALIRALLVQGGDCGDGAKEYLSTALALADRLGAVEWVWRIRRDLALLEPEGPRARTEDLQEAGRIIQNQAQKIRTEELRTAYLPHSERAALQRMAAAGGPV